MKSSRAGGGLLVRSGSLSGLREAPKKVGSGLEASRLKLK
jgi:hypothetical protein